MENMPELALEWHRAGKECALATVIETWGSAPRPVGSQLVIASTGQMMGSVSGGCVEGAVIEAAKEAIQDGKPRHLTFGVSDENAFAVGLACGGTIRILVLPVAATGLSPEILEQIVKARSDRHPLAHLINLADWSQSLTPPRQDLADRFRLDQSGIQDEVFVHIHNPPLRMAIIGAVHIAQALAPMARACGYDVTIVDPRGAFAAAERFPDDVLSDDWPDEALQRIAPDARTAVVMLTHDAKLDDPAIATALASPAFYIGALGSSRTHEKRKIRLKNQGISEATLEQLHAPIGLAIGARTPAEIALSIMAQITAVLRQKPPV